MKPITKKKVATKKPITKKKVVSKNNGFIPKIYREDLEDPRRNLFEAYYTDPLSPTFSNALQSAIKAGFGPTYARNILNLKPSWILTIIDKNETSDLVRIARENIQKFLTMEVSEHVIGIGGHLYDKDENGKKTIPVIADNTKKLEIKAKTTLFVSEKLDPSFNKMNRKEDQDQLKIDFKQIIIINPNNSSQNTIKNI